MVYLTAYKYLPEVPIIQSFEEFRYQLSYSEANLLEDKCVCTGAFKMKCTAVHG